ncbi:DNA mismatch repair protein MutS [Tenacibaculum sp. SZ-18]|uniref:Smr/MutS family protein n=1 Tax=Tenacibaculum sp. SZ-18 TaxID=754423 RepID=UPI000C2D6426|nr:Smr/MutS family protein [Tenacibaculum sp. SZ-18]AUC14495.1 DNA mismatch repair protein MutS [Tenacibaculum sp. SZ-18]
MCLEIGNKVAVLDDVIEGIVTKIMKNEILIKTNDGLELWFDRSELVKIGISQNELTKKASVDASMLRQKVKGSEVKMNSQFKKTKNEVVMEVDLHIEKLVRSSRGMDKYDILSIQMDTAKRKVEYCIQKKISKIIFIHGVGEGVLKSELHYLLNRYNVKYYDASYKEYGLGATEVYVFQN